MTRIIGRPDVPTGTPITATLTYTQPYPRGDRLGIGSHQLDYDWANARWNLKGTATEFDLVAARWEANDPAPRGGVRLTFKVGTGAGQQAGVMGDRGELIPVETAAGVLDITKPIINVAWVAGPALTTLIADATAAAQLAEDAAQQVTDAILDLSAERQAVADSLTATAQSAALATAAAGITPRDNLAAITGADGYYRAMDTGYVYQRETVGSITTNTRRVDLEPQTVTPIVATDGTGDNASAIQAALDSGVKTVLLPAGRIRITTALSVPSGVTLRGAGRGRTILYAESSATATAAPRQVLKQAGVYAKGVNPDDAAAAYPQWSGDWLSSTPRALAPNTNINFGRGGSSTFAVATDADHALIQPGDTLFLGEGWLVPHPIRSALVTVKNRGFITATGNSGSVAVGATSLKTTPLPFALPTQSSIPFGTGSFILDADHPAGATTLTGLLRDNPITDGDVSRVVLLTEPLPIPLRNVTGSLGYVTPELYSRGMGGAPGGPDFFDGADAGFPNVALWPTAGWWKVSPVDNARVLDLTIEKPPTAAISVGLIGHLTRGFECDVELINCTPWFLDSRGVVGRLHVDNTGRATPPSAYLTNGCADNRITGTFINTKVAVEEGGRNVTVDAVCRGNMPVSVQANSWIDGANLRLNVVNGSGIGFQSRGNKNITVDAESEFRTLGSGIDFVTDYTGSNAEGSGYAGGGIIGGRVTVSDAGFTSGAVRLATGGVYTLSGLTLGGNGSMSTANNPTIIGEFFSAARKMFVAPWSGTQTLTSSAQIALRGRTVPVTAASAITLSSGATLPTGVAGARVTVINTGTNGITFQGETTRAGSRLRLGAATRVLSQRGSLTLESDGADWVEVSYIGGAS